MADTPISKDAAALGGTPLFSGTTVPVRLLMEHLEAGGKLEDFLESNPTVSRDQAIEVLQRLKVTLVENSEENLPQAPPEPAFLPYLLKTILVSVAIAALVQFVDRCGVWLSFLLCLLLAVPIFWQRAYFRAMRRVPWLPVFSEEGRIRSWLSGVGWRLIVSSLAGLALAIVMVFRLRALAWQEWLTCAAAIPVFWIAAHIFAERFIVREADTRFRVYVRIKSAIWSTVPVLLLTYGALIAGLPSPLGSEFAPWTRQANEGGIISATVGELDDLHKGWRTLEAFVLGRVSELGEWGWAAAFVIFVACNTAFLYAYVSMLACFSMPFAELSRAFCRATTCTEPPKRDFGVFFGSFVFVVLALILMSIVVMVEVSLIQLPPERRPMRQVREWVAAARANLESRPVQIGGRSTPPTRQAGDITAAVPVGLEGLPKRLPRQSKTVVEKIGDEFCRVGTIKELRDGRRSLLSSQLNHIAVLKRSINRGFDIMEGNIDAFLDWYYSLPAEYIRIAKVLTGSFEGYMAKKLFESLDRGVPLGAFGGAVSSLLESEPAERRKYDETVEQILSRNCSASYDPGRMVVAREIGDPSEVFSYQSLIGQVHPRLVASGFSAASGVAAGVKTTATAGKKITALGGKKVAALAGKKITAGVAKAVTKKIIVKTVFKTAAKVAANVTAKVASASKAAGVGALVGGTVGSIVPIVGTTAGAVAGGVIGGLAFGVGVDALMLELDEAMNRTEFRAELVGVLNMERQRMLDAIAPSTGEQ